MKDGPKLALVKGSPDVSRFYHINVEGNIVHAHPDTKEIGVMYVRTAKGFVKFQPGQYAHIKESAIKGAEG